MRASRLFAVSAVVAAVVGAGLGQAVSGAGQRDPATVVRTDPPQSATSMARSTLAVQLEPLDDQAPDATVDDRVDVLVVVRNPNATAVSGLRVSVRSTGPACAWLEGPFPVPFGLSPGGSAQRTCRLAVDGAGTVRLEATVTQGTAPVATGAVDLVATPGPDPGPDVDQPAPSGPPSVPVTAAPLPAPPAASVTCPRLSGAEVTAGALWSDQLGPALEAGSAGLDVAACPEWAPVAGLRAARHDSGEPCPAWLVWLAGSAEPAVRLSTPASTPPCPAAPLEVEVFDQSTAVAAMVTTLAAWAIDPGPQRAPALHRAATGTGAATCDGTALVAVANPYEQVGAGGGTWYRATVAPC